jgi:bifunctional non-homologous end joining protein LigD
LNVETAILDGELAVPGHHGRTVFAAMMKRRHEAQLFGFDLLSLDGEDLYQLPLLTRKQRLRRILPARSPHVLHADHTRGTGSELSRLACELDLEGIVAERADSPYRDNEPPSLDQDQKSILQSEGRTSGLVQASRIGL